MTEAWREYQLKVARFFTALGLQAETDVRVTGVRTTHDVDVLVKSEHAGFGITWLVECKYWRSKVSKLHVLALREIVADVGADRGILLCESGFQSGALEAAALTNVQVTSLANVQQTARSQIVAMRLRELYDRIEMCKRRYWDISKTERIEHGLRPEVGARGYSGSAVIKLVMEMLTKAFRGAYPIEVEDVLAYLTPGFPFQVKTPEALVRFVEPMIVELEGKIAAYDARANSRFRRRRKPRKPE